MRATRPMQSGSKRATSRAVRRAAMRGVETLERRTLLASIVVNTTADNAIAGDGLTTLREAITAANSNTTTDVITFNLGPGPQTINLTTALPAITRDLSIIGPGAAEDLVVRRNVTTPFGIISVASNARAVTLENLTIANGRAGSGAGIRNEGNLSVRNCLIQGNDAREGAGGGILNVTGSTHRGFLDVKDTRIVGNVARNGAGIYSFYAFATVTRCTISGNSAGNYGGGIFNGAWEYTSVEGTLAIVGSTISGNQAFIGGGIANGESGAITAQDCTIADNLALAGGGIYNYYYARSVDLAHCTIVRNTALGDEYADYPGGIYHHGGDGGVVNAANSIVALNTPTDVYSDFSSPINASHYNFIGDEHPEIDPRLGPLADNGGPTQTIALLDGSLCINRGDPAFTAPPDFDQRGAPFARKVGPRIDIGAFESSFVNASPLPLGVAPQFMLTNTVGDPVDLRDYFDDAEDGSAGLVYTVVGNTNPALITSTLIDNATDVLALDSADAEGVATITVRATDAGGLFVESSFDVTVLLDSFVVNTTADNAVAGDGLTSLREAIASANVYPDANTITFELGPRPHTINLSSTLPNILSEMNVQGPGADLLTLRPAGDAKLRILNIGEDLDPLLSPVTVSGMTFSSGTAHHNPDAGPFGGGAILNNGPLTVRDCTFSENSSIGFGGAIVNRRPLTLIGCTFRDNDAKVGSGGAIGSEAPLVVIGCTFTGNTAGIGGAIASSFADLTISDSVFTGNGAESGSQFAGVGGAIHADGTTTILRSTISGNSAGYGGGLAGGWYFTFTIRDSTISGNTATTYGGGIHMSSGTSLKVINSTVANNTAGVGGGIYTEGASTSITHSTIAGNSANWVGGVFGSITAANSIIAANVSESGLDLWGTLDPSSHNFIGQDHPGVDPLLGPLADNGGPTWTMALLPGSPLINGGDPDFAAPPDFDQRGNSFPRVIGGRIDIGAFEFNAAPPTTGVPAHTVPEDAANSSLNLRNWFNDEEDGPAGLVYSIVGNTNPALFSSVSIDAATDVLTLDYADDANGVSYLTVRATDSAGAYVDSTFAVKVLSVAQQVQGLVAQVNSLPLSAGNINSLVVKLNLKGNPSDFDKVNTFIDAIREFVLDGKLTSRQAELVIANAEDLLISLG
jgi:CSLREA domain-containing protein